MTERINASKNPVIRARTLHENTVRADERKKIMVRFERQIKRYGDHDARLLLSHVRNLVQLAVFK